MVVEVDVFSDGEVVVMDEQMGPCIGGCRLPENHLGHCCVNPEPALFVQCTKCLWHLRSFDCQECGNERYVRVDGQSKFSHKDVNH